MDEMEVEALWEITNQLLVSGQTHLAYCFFRVALRTIRLYALKYCSSDILLQKNDDAQNPRSSIRFEAYIDKAWGIVLMAHTHGQSDFSKKCFETELRKVQRRTLEMCCKSKSEPYIVIDKEDL